MRFALRRTQDLTLLPDEVPVRRSNRRELQRYIARRFPIEHREIAEDNAKRPGIKDDMVGYQ
jgi:hypothetical protein